MIAPPLASPPAPALEARRIVLARGGRTLLAGAGLRLRAGAVASLQGPSGCGKSTFLRVLAGLEEPDAGEVLLGGVEAHRLPPRLYRTRVACVPQQPPMLEGTVAANVAAGPALRGETLAPQVVGQLLERVGLDASFAQRDARPLSGGERQRVALARALANGPEVLLLDEPTAALDPAAAGRILALVRQLAADGLAVLVVTHAEEHARLLGGTRHRCEAGRIWQAEEAG